MPFFAQRSVRVVTSIAALLFAAAVVLPLSWIAFVGGTRTSLVPEMLISTNGHNGVRTVDHEWVPWRVWSECSTRADSRFTVLADVPDKPWLAYQFKICIGLSGTVVVRQELLVII